MRITSPDDGASVGLAANGAVTATVSGRVDLHSEPNLAGVEIEVGGTSQPVSVDPVTGGFVTVVSLDPAGGDQLVTAHAVDELGHEATDTITLHVVPGGPSITVSTPPDLQWLGGGSTTMTVTGTARGADGSRVEVNGYALDASDPEQLSWSVADTDGLRNAVFAADVAMPAEDGPFLILARVEDLEGRKATVRRTLVLDTTPPEVLETAPVDGAENVDRDALVLVLMSEEVDTSSLSEPGGIQLERLATSEPVASELAIAGQAIAVVPGAALVPGESYRLTIGAGVRDLAGNQMVAPVEVVFTVSEAGAGMAPVLDELDEVVCAAWLLVEGSAAPGATVRVAVGSLAFTGFADDNGRFAVTVALPGEGYHLLKAVVVEADGSAGPAAETVVRVDCKGPRVIRANLDAEAALISIEMSEAVDPVTAVLGGPDASVSLSDADTGDAIPATLSVTGADDRLELALDPDSGAAWRDLTLMLEVGPPLADPQGNPAQSFEALLLPGGGGGIAGGYLLGEAFDDANGRPLAGVSAALYPAGAALPGAVPDGSEADPLASDLSDDRGRYRLLGEVSAGRYALLLSRSGYAPVVRRLALEPASGVVPFDARLTPRAQAAGELDPVSGANLSSPAVSGLRVVADPGAVPGVDSLSVRLTARSGQSLPDLLPLGWTPAACAELHLEQGDGTAIDETVVFANGGVRLDLPLPAWVAPSDQVFAVRHRLGSGVWTALAAPERLDVAGIDIARLSLPGPGTYAVVVADEVDGPALPDEGTSLVGVPVPEAFPELDATLTLDPQVVPPTGKATARVVAMSTDLQTTWPSGLAVQAYLQERLELTGGGQLHEAPFSSDLLLYHPRLEPEDQGSAAAGAAGVVEFWVAPSARAAQVLLEVGWEDIKLFPFPEQLERGLLVGPAGGSVTSPDGIEVVLPEGALPERTVVQARLLSAADLSTLPAIAGYDTVAAMRLEWDGHELAREATIRLPEPAATPDPLAGDPRLILVEWLEDAPDGRGGYPRLAARISRLPAGDGLPARLEAAPEAPGSQLPLEGLTREGLYLVLWAQQPIAFATGLVSMPSGFPLEGSRVEALTLGTADLSRTGGRYTAPALAAGGMLTARHPSLDEAGSAPAPATAPGTVVVVDLVVEPVAPELQEVNPLDGTLNVPLGIQVWALFTEALDPAAVSSMTLRLELAGTNGSGSGAFVRGAVSLGDGGRRIVFSPELALAPGRTYLAHFSGDVRDQGGVSYQDGPVTWSFTTATVVVPGGQVRPDRFHVRIPEDGQTIVWADPGAVPVVPQGQIPWAISPLLVNPDYDPLSVPTVSANSVGGMPQTTIGDPPRDVVDFDSEVWVRVYDPAGDLATTFRLGPFASEDGRGFVVPAGEAVTFTTSDGIGVDVPEGAFDKGTLVRVEPLPADSVGVDAGLGLGIAAYLRVDFEGEAAESLVLKVPAPADVPDGAQVVLGSRSGTAWGQRLSVVDLGGVVEEGGQRYLTNHVDAQPPIEGVTKSGPARCRTLTRIHQPVDAAWYYEMGAELAFVTFGVSLGMGASYEAFFNAYNDAWVYNPPASNWCAKVVLPVVPGEPVLIESRDIATGWLVTSQSYGNPEDPDGDGVINLENLLGPQPGPPRLLSATPFHFIHFAAPGDDEVQRLRLDLEASGDSSGRVTLDHPDLLELPENSSVALYGIADPEEVVPFIDRAFVCAQDLPRSSDPAVPDEQESDLLAVVGPATLEASTFDAFVFHFSRAITADLDLIPDPSQIVEITDQGSTEGCGGSGDSVDVTVKLETDNDGQTLRVTPLNGFREGRRYELELKTWNLFVNTGECPNGPDQGQLCAGPRFFQFATRDVKGQSIISSDLGSGQGRDLLKVGNLLFVATLDGNLYAYDLSGGGGSNVSTLPRHTAMRKGAVSQIRGLGTDGHRRVFGAIQTGGMWAVRAIDVEDVENPTADDGLFAPREGAIRVS